MSSSEKTRVADQCSSIVGSEDAKSGTRSVTSTTAVHGDSSAKGSELANQAASIHTLGTEERGATCQTQLTPETDTAIVLPSSLRERSETDNIRQRWQSIIAGLIEADGRSDLQAFRMVLEEALGAPSAVPKTVSLSELSDDDGLPPPSEL
jgi:hypothetical protein